MNWCPVAHLLVGLCVPRRTCSSLWEQGPWAAGPVIDCPVHVLSRGGQGGLLCLLLLNVPVHTLHTGPLQPALMSWICLTLWPLTHYHFLLICSKSSVKQDN